MIFAETNLIFGTDHTITFNAADLCHFHGQRPAIFWIYGAAYGGHYYFLSCRHIGCAANNLQRSALPGIYCGNAQFIGVRVFFSCQNLADHEALQASFEAFI
jgi:hypothetical protein